MMPTRCPPSVMRVIAGPGLAPDCLSRAAKMPNDVAVGIQNADGWDCGVRQRFLPPRFAQERARAEHRWHGRTLIVQDRRHEQGSLASPSRTSTRIAEGLMRAEVAINHCHALPFRTSRSGEFCQVADRKAASSILD
jgi:hypothetical protein